MILFQVHNKCATNVVPECNLGEHREHILPPVSISPAGLVCWRSVFYSKCFLHPCDASSCIFARNVHKLCFQLIPLDAVIVFL